MGPFLYSLEWCIKVVRRARGRFVCVLTHTHTVRLLVNNPRSGTCLSVHHMHTHTHILWYPKRGAELGSCVFDHSYQHTLTHSI